MILTPKNIWWYMAPKWNMGQIFGLGPNVEILFQCCAFEFVWCLWFWFCLRRAECQHFGLSLRACLNNDALTQTAPNLGANKKNAGILSKKWWQQRLHKGLTNQKCWVMLPDVQGYEWLCGFCFHSVLFDTGTLSSIYDVLEGNRI